MGLFGGAFDPPHWAHRQMAETVLAQLRLDVLHILPTGQAWHKTRPLTPAPHRLAMCRQAFGDMSRVVVDDREIRRQGPSYTIDTVSELAREYPGADLFLLIGADQLLAFQTWQRWPEVLQLATLVVADRAEHIGEDAVSDAHPPQNLSAVAVPFVSLSMPLKNISATAVRALRGTDPSRGAALDALVPEGVARYISEHHLYETPA